MSARLLYSLSEENSNLQRQKGCINGIMQMFEGHSFLMGRSINSQNPKRIQSAGRSDDEGTRFKNSVYKSREEKERNSPKFSRASTSSSSSSTATSLECSQRAQREPSSSRRNTPKVLILGRGSSSIVEIDEQVGRPMKHIDSPRPRFPSTPVKDRLSGPYESSHPSSADQIPPPSIVRRNTSRVSAAKDAPRLSFDERESRGRSKSIPKFESPRLSLDSRRQALTRTTSGRKSDLISAKLQAEQSYNRRDTDLQLVPGRRRPISNVVAKLMGLEAFPDCSAVNKGHIQPDECNMGENREIFEKSPRNINERELNHVPNSLRKPMAHPNTIQSKTRNPTMKSSPATRTSPEPMSRKQSVEHHMMEKPVPKHHKDDSDPQSLSSSIYGEIEKRLSELDFQNSGTDLRALKQILEAMQKTRLQRSIKDRAQSKDHVSYSGNNHSKYMSSDQSPRGPRRAKCQVLHDNCKMPIISRDLWTSEDDLSQILETKPDKFLSNSAISSTFIIQDEGFKHDPNLRRLRTHQLPDGKKSQEKKKITKVLANNPHFQDPLPHSLDATENCSRARKVTAAKTPKLPKHTTKDELTSPSKRTATMRNLKLENQYHFPASPSEPLMIKQHNVQQVESGTSPERITSKYQAGGNLPTTTIIGSTRSCQQGKSASQLPERDIKMVNEIKTAVMNQKMQNGTMLQADGNEDFKERPTSKITTALQEQPSPVSVLDAAFYVDEPPSPVKKKPVYYRDEETLTMTETVRYQDLPENPRSKFGYEIHHPEPESLKHIDCQPRQHISIKNAGQDPIMLVTRDLNAEERYLFEILLASGFMGGVEFRLSDGTFSETQAINPKLFCIMEQTRSILSSFAESASGNSNLTSRLEDKVERRLVFDVANEILVQKLNSSNFSSEFSPLCNKKPTGSSISGPQLLKELSSEIESLQANSKNKKFDNQEDLLGSIIEKDLINGSLNWILSSGEVPGLVLDVERLIFKDLVVELLDD